MDLWCNVIQKQGNNTFSEQTNHTQQPSIASFSMLVWATYSMKLYPTKRAACEKNAMIIKFTWPKILVIFSAPYKNGILLTVPTVIVIPENEHKTEKANVNIQSNSSNAHSEISNRNT